MDQSVAIMLWQFNQFYSIGPNWSINIFRKKNFKRLEHESQEVENDESKTVASFHKFGPFLFYLYL